MIKFLKYILIVFGSLGIVLVTFFYLQNKHDLDTYFELNDRLEYESLVKNCLEIKNKYYYPCFREEFKKVINKVGITGRSLTLKKAFNFIEKDKKNYSGLDSQTKNILYSIHFLEINNIVLTDLEKNYFGFTFLQPVFKESVKRFQKNAYDFSENIIFGLEGVDGLVAVSGRPVFKSLQDYFLKTKEEYFKLKKNALRQ